MSQFIQVGQNFINLDQVVDIRFVPGRAEARPGLHAREAVAEITLTVNKVHYIEGDEMVERIKEYMYRNSYVIVPEPKESQE